jgi:hypothetical protein
MIGTCAIAWIADNQPVALHAGHQLAVNKKA